MRKRVAFASLALVLVVSIAVTGTAGATPETKAQAQILGPVVTSADGSVASVKARYICPEGFHLWVSAKQAAGGQPDPVLREEGSSEFSSAWLQSHPQDFTCDGRWHTETFQIDKTETFEENGQVFGPIGFGTLEQGQAWVQFCLIGEQAFISDSRWVAVR